MRVGFIGLGSMGSAMAASLVRMGQDVTVYNRTAGRAQPLVAQGARLAGSVASACRGEAVVTMLANDEAVESVVFGNGGIIASLRPNGVHVSSSTISPRLAQRLAQAHAAAGQRYVSAPVFGRPDVAAAGRLVVVAAGASDAVEAANPIFKSIGRATFVVSESPPAANLVKLSGNFLLASMIESLGEAMALVEQGGVDRQRYLDVMLSLFDSPPFRTYGSLIAQQRYEPAGFAAPLGQKDIGLALEAADDLRVPMPLALLLHARFAELLAMGGEKLDWSAIAGLAANDAFAARAEAASSTSMH